MHADVPTMFLAIILVGAVLSLSVGAVADRRQHDGMVFWAVGLALHTLAYICFSLRGQISDIVSIVLANTALSCALATFTEGLYAFYQSRAPRRLIWLPVVFVFLVFFALLDQLVTRIIVGSLVFVAQCLLALTFMWRQRRQTAGRGKYFLASGIAVMTALLTLRAAGAATGAAAAMLSLSQSSLMQTLTFLGALTSLLLLAIGFVLMSKERSDQLNQIMATQDDLTGLANRRRLNEVLAIEWARAHRSGQPLGLIMIDIDWFKGYNDLYGHQAGDDCLQRVARTMETVTQRAGDLAARYGGEEFILILPDADASAAQRVAEALRQSVQALAIPHNAGADKHVTISLGVAVLSEACYPDAEGLLRAADAALYRAKDGGRNQVQLAPEALRHAAPVKLVQLIWRSAYECGNAVIDGQHRQLFNDINTLLGAMLGERKTDEVAALVQVFIADVMQHFEEEEALIKAAGYPGAEDHARQHRLLLDKARTVTEDFRIGKLALGEVFEYLAHDLVARHLLITDREFFASLQPRAQAAPITH